MQAWNNKGIKLQDEWLLMWSEEEIVLLKKEKQRKEEIK